MTGYLPLAITAAVVSLMLFRFLYLRSKVVWLRVVLVVAAIALATPAALFISNYILHIPESVWFINFHSLPGIEATSGLVGALLGILFASARLRPNMLDIPVMAVATIIAFLMLLVPFGKQLFCPLDYSALENRWNDGVCQLVVLMSKNGSGPEIGNPYGRNRIRYTWDAFERHHHPSLIYFAVSKL